jgi:cyclophilin family peptidyl-prolyl cis-trans isomerase
VKISRSLALSLVFPVACLGLAFAGGCGSKSTGPATLASSEPAFEGRDAVDLIDEFIAAHPIDTSQPEWRTRVPRPPAVFFPEGRSYEWILTTSEGMIRIRLMPEYAPHHVASTIYLTRLGFYDGLSFHRVIPGFMAQGGCPLGTGTGGPGYTYDGECSPAVRHDKPGLLSMANAGPGTDGSQFFLTFVETAWLDGKHTIFGEVVQGMDTVQILESKGGSQGGTKEPLLIEEATITAE